MKIDIKAIFARHPFAKVLLAELEKAGHEAVLVGGVVRDAARAQIDENFRFDPKEVDIATSALPAEIKKIFSNRRMLEVGEAFGVLMIHSPEGEPYEVATFRTEGDYDGRRPGRVAHVRHLEEDLVRRDFTVNGLAARRDGVILDYVGGIPDLKQKIIRAIGQADERFSEDFLRMLRAIRFACLLGAEIEAETIDAIEKHAEGIRKISAERIRDEFLGLLATSQSARGLEIMDEVGLLEILLPELIACKGIAQPEKYHPEGDVYTHTLLAMRIGDFFIKNPRVKLALLLHDIGKPMALQINQGVNAGGHDLIGAEMAGEICRRLRMSKPEVRFVYGLVREHQRIGQFHMMTRGHQAQFLTDKEDKNHPIRDFGERFPVFTQLMRLMIADCQASAMKSDGWLSVLKAAQPLLLHLQELDENSRAQKLIDGHDLKKLGMREGKALGEMLKAIHEAIFSGDVMTRADALKLAKRLIAQNKN